MQSMPVLAARNTLKTQKNVSKKQEPKSKEVTVHAGGRSVPGKCVGTSAV